VYVKQFTSDPRAREKPCLRCRTSLRKNLDDKYCPQCGLSVWLSLNPNDTLEWSNPPWLRKSARGATILAIAQPMAFIAYLLVALGNVTAPMWGAYSEMDIESGMTDGDLTAATQPAEVARHWTELAQAYANATSIPVAIGIVIAGVYFLVNAGGLVLLTSHEERYPDRMKTVRLGSQIVAGASALLGLALITMGVPRLASGWRVNGPGSSLLLFVAEIAFAACACCAWLWLRRIAQRAGKPFLSKLCGYLLFLPVLPFLKAAPFLGLYFLAFLIVPLLYVLPVLYIPLSVYLFIRFALLMRKAAPEAEKSWASETKPQGWVAPAPAPPPQFTS
jgi:hypothetical protein